MDLDMIQITVATATNTPLLYGTGREIGSSTVTYDEFCHLHIVSIHERSSTKTLRTTRCLKIYSVFKGGNFTNALLKSALHFILSSHFLKIEDLLDTMIIRIEFENFFSFPLPLKL